VAGTDILHLDRKESASFRGNNIGFIFQDFNLLPVLTVYENIEYPLLMVQSAPAPEREKRVSALLEAVGITAVSYRFFSRGKENGKGSQNFPGQGDCRRGMDTLKWNKIVSHLLKS